MDRATEETLSGHGVLRVRDIQALSPKEHIVSGPPPWTELIDFAGGTIIATSDGEREDIVVFYVIENTIKRSVLTIPDTSAAIVARRRDVQRRAAEGPEIQIERNAFQLALGIVGDAEIQYKVLPDKFIDVFEIEPLVALDSGRIEVVVNNEGASATLQAQILFENGRANILIPGDWSSLPFAEDGSGFPTLSKATVTSIETQHGSPSFECEGVWSASSTRIGEQMVQKARASSLTRLFSDGPVTATREIYRGIQFLGFSHRFFPRRPRLFDLMLSSQMFVVSIFGRDGRLYRFNDSTTAVIYEGEPLDIDHWASLTTLITYLAGNRAQHLGTETFGDGGRVGFTFRDRGERTESAMPPLFLDNRYQESEESRATLAAHFPRMLDEVHQLRKGKPTKLDAAIHHYHDAANSSVADTRIVFLAVAINTLVSLSGRGREVINIVEPRTPRRALKVYQSGALENVPGVGGHLKVYHPA